MKKNKNKKPKEKKILKKKIELCSVCERDMGGDWFGCEKCGQLVCDGCFDNDTDRCIECR